MFKTRILKRISTALFALLLTIVVTIPPVQGSGNTPEPTPPFPGGELIEFESIEDPLM